MIKAKNKTVTNPIIVCDECKKSFKLKKNRIKKEWVTPEIQRSFFICPHCKHKYTICYEDNEFRGNIANMDKLKKQMSSLGIDSVQSKEILESYQKYHERNIQISKGYREKYDK